MSEAEPIGTNILLPAARVAVFSKDEDTVSCTTQFKDDWRFARVEVSASQGDVEDAISAYKGGEVSPDLLIIQTDTIDDGFTDRLAALSEYCHEGTAAIIIGPVNDVYLYRRLIEMGISDYLVRPIEAAVFSDVIAKSLTQRLGVSDSRLISFTGAKGGVGASVLSQVSALLSSDKLGQKTILLDAAGGASSSSVGLGFDPSATLSEVYRAVNAGNEDSFQRMIHAVNDQLSVLATGVDAMLDRSLSAEQFEEILDHLMVQYPVVLVDLSGAEASVRKAVIARATQTIVISTPTVTSLRFCRSLLSEVSDIRGETLDGVSLLLNQCGAAKGHEVSTADVEEVLGCKPVLTFDYAPSVFVRHESEVSKMISDKDFLPVVKDFLPFLQKLIVGDTIGDSEEDEKNSGLLGGFLNKLSSK